MFIVEKKDVRVKSDYRVVYANVPEQHRLNASHTSLSKKGCDVQNFDLCQNMHLCKFSGGGDFFVASSVKPPLVVMEGEHPEGEEQLTDQVPGILDENSYANSSTEAQEQAGGLDRIMYLH